MGAPLLELSDKISVAKLRGGDVISMFDREVIVLQMYDGKALAFRDGDYIIEMSQMKDAKLQVRKESKGVIDYRLDYQGPCNIVSRYKDDSSLRYHLLDTQLKNLGH